MTWGKQKQGKARCGQKGHKWRAAPVLTQSNNTKRVCRRCGAREKV